MRYIARSGRTRFLILDSGTVDDPKARGHIYDLIQRRAFPSTNLHSLLARGYWEQSSGLVPLDLDPTILE